MKKLLLTTALAAGLALPALAQDAVNSPFLTEVTGPSVSASDVIGARIYVSEAAVDADSYKGVQQDWKDIGEVNDIILSRDGKVDAVLVDIGGFLGIGERQVALNMSALKIVQDDATDADDWFLVMQSDQATLEGAPEYMRPGAAGNTGAANDAAATNGTVANNDAAANNGTDTAATDTTAQGTATDKAVEDSTMAQGTEGAGNATDTALPADGDGTTQSATTAPAVNGDGTLTLPEGYKEVGRDTLTAEMLTGADVRDPNDQSIAEVSDLALTADGQVTDVILDVGGFLGIGARSVAIPMDRLTVGQTEGGGVRIWVNMTKDELKALPEHTM